MKKFLYFVAVAMITLATSCSSGYDQKKVDALNIDNPSTEDYYEMVKQVGYALDDAESAKDPEKWEKDNAKEAESMAGMIVALIICEDMDPNFPKDLKKDVKNLSDRFDKLAAKMLPADFDLDDLDNVDDDDLSDLFDDIDYDEVVEAVEVEEAAEDYKY